MVYGSGPGLRCPSPRRALVGSLKDMVFSKTTSSNGAHRLGTALAVGPGLATQALQPTPCNPGLATQALQPRPCNPGPATQALQPRPCNPGLASEKSCGSEEAWQGQADRGRWARTRPRLPKLSVKEESGRRGRPALDARETEGAPARHNVANPRPTARRRHAARGLKAEIEPFPKLEVPVALGSDLAVPSAGHCLLGHKHEGFKSPAAARAQFQNAPRALEGLTATKKVKVQIQPKVTFSQGKAVKASLNWGKIEAPRIAKTALGLRRLQSIIADERVRSYEVHGAYEVRGVKVGVAGRVTAWLCPRCAPDRAPNRSCLRGTYPSPPHPRQGRRFP